MFILIWFDWNIPKTDEQIRLFVLPRKSVLDFIVLLIQITLILSDIFRKYSFFQNIFSDKLHKSIYTSIFFLQRYLWGKIYDNFSRIFESGGIIFSKGTNYFFNKFCTAAFRLKGWLATIIDKQTQWYTTPLCFTLTPSRIAVKKFLWTCFAATEPAFKKSDRFVW